MCRFALLTPILALSLAGCSKEAPVPQATHAAAPAAPALAPAPEAKARKVSEANDLYEFDYAYPAQAAAVPALKDWLDKDLNQAKAQLVADVGDARTDAKANDYPYRAYSASKDWQVITDLPGWLSLSTLIGSFTGGAHPNYAFDAILWDKRANARRAAADLFTSKAALKSAILKPFCTELDRQRKKKRGGEDWGTDISEFTQCIDPLEQVLILGSVGHNGFDRIGFLIAPYNAGPYAEGDYEVTLPVTRQVLEAVKPEFRSAFVSP